MLIKNISKKLYAMAKEEQKFAHALYEKSQLTILLILALAFVCAGGQTA